MGFDEGVLLPRWDSVSPIQSGEGRQEISPCTVFLYWQNHQGAQTCTSAAVEALEQRNIRSAAPWITSESNINKVHVNNTNRSANHFSTFTHTARTQLFTSQSHTLYLSLTILLSRIYSSTAHVLVHSHSSSVSNYDCNNVLSNYLLLISINKLLFETLWKKS